MKNNKYILVGDMHVKPDTIEECWAILRWVHGLCLSHGAVPIFMGDQMDTHGNVRVEVLEFWNKAYRELFNGSSISLVGNHDMDYACKNSSMSPFAGVTKVVRDLQCIDHELGLWGVGYIKSAKEFEEQVRAMPHMRVVLCHQEFNGAQYESGFYAPHGVLPQNLPKGVTFISGHIHLKQRLGDQVLYVGTPRQMTRADQDNEKSVWLLDQNGVQPILVPEEISPRFVRLKLQEPLGQDWPEIKNPSKTFVDVHGSADFIKRVLKKLPEGVRVRTFPARERAAAHVSESSGINVAFARYVSGYIVEKKLSQDQVALVTAKLKEVCPEFVNG